MPLLRKSSKDQLKKIRDIVKKNGGDIADKTTKYDSKLPNLYWLHNPSDTNIDTYEDNYTLGNNTKISKTKMNKHVKTFEQYESEQLGMNRIPELYIKQWLDYYNLWCDENKTESKFQSLCDIYSDDDILEIFNKSKIYCDEHSIFLDGQEFMKASYVKEDKNLDILRVGKGIDLGDVKGIINRLEGKFVYIETEGGKIVCVPIGKVLKKLKQLSVQGFNYIDKKLKK